MSRLREIAVQVMNGVIPLSEKELAAERLKVCHECENFAKLTDQCRVCWCFMQLKTKMLEANCPIGKW